MQRFVRTLIVLTAFFLFSVGFVYAEDPQPSPAPEPPSTPATPPPPETPDPEEEEFPFIGCGGTHQACCEMGPNAVFGYKCFFKEDSQVLYDELGRVVPKAVAMHVGGKSCQCVPDEEAKELYKQRENQTKAENSSANQLCKKYFSPSNHINVIHGGVLSRNETRELPDEEIDRLNSELASCVECVYGQGVYTSLGCIPYSFNGILSAVLLIGISIGGAYALLCIIFSAIRIQMSRGDSQAIQTARENVTGCLIGLILILFSVFIINALGGGVLGFTLQNPFSNSASNENSENPGEPGNPEDPGNPGDPEDPRDPGPGNEIVCSRECTYSEGKPGEEKCYRGACPANEPECGKRVDGSLGTLNLGCKYAPQCGNFKEVACP